eukprot:15450856-Alexandrium_andersonii.AAC.1
MLRPSPKTLPGGRGPGPPEGPSVPLCGSGSADIGAPPFRGVRFARSLRRPPLHCWGAPRLCRFRATERAIRSVGRAGTAASQG